MKNLPKINLVYDTLHGMSYYTFLKSLRNLEEFRKIPKPKSLLNLLAQIFKVAKKFEFQKN
jgi:hypothetical protein